MTDPPAPHRKGSRVAAILALVALATAILVTVVAALSRWTVLLASVVLLSLVIVASWYVVSRRGMARGIALVVAAVALVAFIATVISSNSLWTIILALLLGAVSVGAAGFALRSGGESGQHASAPRARHPVLLMNPKSGGGKAEKFGLADRCRELGIQPILLTPGDDLLQLAEAAVTGGADLIGMAGGDGSQALVASVASRHGVPFVVVPAGTRNHFALDLGIDREDVPAALEAYQDGVDTVIDLAEVNGRVFVNNAAMGVYATIVQSADYRDAKLATAAATLPDLLGPDTRSSDLVYTMPDGETRVAGQLLLVSNNPYELRHLRGAGRRLRLDGGVLGAASLTVNGPGDAQAVAALELAGHLDRFSGWQEWTADTIEVRCPRPVEIGVDGEALVLDSPLRFSCHPAALTVRLPRAALTRAAEAAPLRVRDRSTIAALWRLAVGRGETR